jgi:hypothetical protein
LAVFLEVPYLRATADKNELDVLPASLVNEMVDAPQK